MTCNDCRSVPPLEDWGTVMVRCPGDPGRIQEFRYGSKDELMALLTDGIVQALSTDEVEIRLSPSEEDRREADAGWQPLAVWQARVRHADLIDIMRRRRFTSHMQPIIELATGSVYGYELLLRPLAGDPGFKPYELFQAAQETGLHSFLDRAARISAIETGARHLRQGLKRFINFLPSSIYNPAYCLTHTFQAIQSNRQSPADFVFEVVETERIVDIPKLASIFEAYKENGVKVALDDVGAGYSTLDVVASLKPDYVKIDRNWVSLSDRHPDSREGLFRIVEAARNVGATVLAEGVERPEELEVCREAGVDLVQGYLFGKPSPQP